LAQNAALVGAGNVQDSMPARSQRRKTQRDTFMRCVGWGDMQVVRRVGRERVIELAGAGKQRSRVAVVAPAEDRQIDVAGVVVGRLDRLCDRSARPVQADEMGMRSAVGEQMAPYQALVTVGVLWRNIPLINQLNVNVRPVEVGL